MSKITVNAIVVNVDHFLRTANYETEYGVRSDVHEQIAERLGAGMRYELTCIGSVEPWAMNGAGSMSWVMSWGDPVTAPAPEPAGDVERGLVRDWKAYRNANRAKNTLDYQEWLEARMLAAELVVADLRAELERVRNILNGVYAERDNARDDAEGLRAENARLREALKPFAALASFTGWNTSASTGGVVYRNDLGVLTVADFQNAAQLLDAASQPAGE